MHAELISLCRICLENGATLPIFETKEQSSFSSILSKMSLCFGGEIEDVDSYPNKICDTCNTMLDKACDFINKYRESCMILKKNLEIIITQESIETRPFQEPCDKFKCKENIKYKSPWEILAGKKEITVEILKKESWKEDFDITDHINEDTDQFTLNTNSDEDGNNQQQTKNIEVTKSIVILNKKRKKYTRNLIKKSQSKIYGNRTNRIASSLLEGEFTWTKRRWSIIESVSTRQQNVKEESSQKGRQPSQKIKNRNLNEKITKITEQNNMETNKQEENRTNGKKRQCKGGTLCDHCGKVYLHATSFKEHIQLLNISQQYKCTLCPRILKSQRYLDEHCARVHDKVGKKFICTACGRAFAFRRDLSKHHRNVHNEEYKKKLRNELHYCNVCGKSCKTSVALIRHTRSAHTGERPAVCSVCDAKFFHADYLKEHMRLHTGETPFKCPICQRGYAQRGNMLSHVKHNHRKSQFDETLLKSLKPNILKAMRP